MVTINARELIRQFRIMYEQHWRYTWGGAEKGNVDCSGAFTYAYRQAGISCPHGSNAIARQMTVGGMLPVSMAEPGMAAFKAREPGENGYSLPAKYKPGGSGYNGDLTDYYHVGLVDDDPAYVLNAKGEKSGFCRDRIDRGGWDFVARLKDVDYKEDSKVEWIEAKVVLPEGSTGSTVNMRSGASTSAPVIARVPVGNYVRVTTENGDWTGVTYGGTPGFMMTRFLEFTSIGGEGTDGAKVPNLAEVDDALLKIDGFVQSIQEQTDRIAAALGLSRG